MLTNDPTVSYDIFLKQFKELYDSAFPLEQLKRHRNHIKPWIDASLLKRINRRNKLFASFIQAKNLDQLAEYKKLRNKITYDIKHARNLYYQEIFASISNDSRKVWNCVNALRNKNEREAISEIVIEGVPYSGILLSKKFYDYFLKAGFCASSRANSVSCTSYIHCSNSSIFMSPATSQEMYGL